VLFRSLNDGIQAVAGVLSVIACYFNYDSPRMNAQRSPWAQPGVIALIAVIVAINLVVDWLWFRPTKAAAFIIVEACRRHHRLGKVVSFAQALSPVVGVIDACLR